MSSGRVIRLGGHGLPVDANDPEAFARAHVAFGYGAAYCPPVTLDDVARLRAIETAFLAADVSIAEIGIWRNLIAPEDERRRANLAYAAEQLAIADEVGARCAVSYLGSFAPGTDHDADPRNLGPEAFDAAVETVRHLLDSIKPRRTKFALEMMQNSLPDSIDAYVDLIAAIDRPAFAAHLDPVNLIMAPRTYWNNAALIRECFEKLGPWIVSCHAKDITLRPQAALHLDEVIIGTGVLDYRAYITALQQLPSPVPLMLEHLEPGDYAVARDAVFAVGDAAGIEFMHWAR
ncbi:MAG: hypothetical protein JWR75_2039 [Devosia sp.]|nr:hypothetical protein [Devosia sp.]